MRSTIHLLTLVSLVLAASGCAHSFPDLTRRAPSRGLVSAPPEHALLTILHGRRGGDGVVVFSAAGEALCQVPLGTHCVVPLEAGAHRLYVYWNAEIVDVLDTEVAAGRAYYATVNWGYMSPVDEALTPSLDRWSHLPEWLASPETWLDDAALARIRLEVPDFERVRARGEARFSGYDAHHVAAHTIRPQDGV